MSWHRLPIIITKNQTIKTTYWIGRDEMDHSQESKNITQGPTDIQTDREYENREPSNLW